jgi:hypothetical protein
MRSSWRLVGRWILARFLLLEDLPVRLVRLGFLACLSEDDDRNILDYLETL